MKKVLLPALASLALAAASSAAPELKALRSELEPALTAGAASSIEAAARQGQDIQDIISRAKTIRAAALEATPDATLGEVPPTPEAKAAGIGAGAGFGAAQVPDANEAQKSSFAEVWGALKQNPLASPYPKSRVSFFSFFKGLTFRLLESARRTLDDHRDLLPDFQKLIRPNGVALSGVWEITEENPYSGYFAKGSRALVIARASSFSDDTDRGDYRSFGLALKLYPADDPAARRKTANVFLIDDNGGTKASHFTDAALTTHPKMSLHGGVLLRSPIMAAVTLAQHLADKNPGYRQLYPVSELGVAPEGLPGVKTPGRLLLRGTPGTVKLDAKDFREELDAAKYPAPGLQFDVFVAESEKDAWKKIGRVLFSDSVVSHAVDHNLHFPHPRYQDSQSKGY